MSHLQKKDMTHIFFGNSRSAEAPPGSAGVGEEVEEEVSGTAIPGVIGKPEMTDGAVSLHPFTFITITLINDFSCTIATFATTSIVRRSSAYSVGDSAALGSRKGQLVVLLRQPYRAGPGVAIRAL